MEPFHDGNYSVYPCTGIRTRPKASCPSSKHSSGSAELSAHISTEKVVCDQLLVSNIEAGERRSSFVVQGHNVVTKLGI